MKNKEIGVDMNNKNRKLQIRNAGHGVLMDNFISVR